MPEERKNLCVFLLEKVPPGLPRRFSSSFFRRGDLWKYQYFFSLLAKTTFFELRNKGKYFLSFRTKKRGGDFEVGFWRNP